MLQKKLMKLAQEQDANALTQIIEEHYDMIYRYCYKKVGDSFVAQDITQDTFLRFVSNIDTYSNCGKLKAYLYTIARNLCNDWYRQKKPVLLDEKTEILDFSTMNSLNKVIDNISLKQMISKLPSAQQEVIILRYGEDLKLREIADITGTTIFAIQYRLKAALSKLKKLEKEGYSLEK
ncbi:RNA polymerase sigma factor [Vallitalea guaymasensis]|uniref:RNA polymerase sigma factor n=1 Tax=Vallitalea guaymasensis TaxID=1185412 RepID=A0A8J8M996_9FIRM|nr:RNA polymerase sigma factor [Vallitalea guaymasensis]QUH28683.1 RNA polymerase sigma factor [Vallitalea guaymasensis]